MRRTTAAVCALAVLWIQPVGATDLLEAWRAAERNDLDTKSARAAQRAGEARRGQATALWRPTVQFSGTLGRASSDTATRGAQFSAPGFGQSSGADFITSIDDGNATRWMLQARQPLVSRERDAQQAQLERSADVADLQWQAAQQALILRTAERYFDAVLAAESLRVLRRQQASVAQASTEANDRFRIGDLPVTDTYEAGARAQAVNAQVLAAEMQLQLARAALSDVTGLPDVSLQALRPADDAPPSTSRPLAEWIADTQLRNLQLRQQKTATEVAQLEAAKFGALASPTLDLVAQVGQDRLRGSGDFGAASNRATNALIGVQLTVPLYTGGYRSAKQEEALQRVEQAAADADRGAQQVAQQTRAAWLGLDVGAGRVRALTESLKATLARRDATRLGRQVGDRTTLDLLNAENDASTAELALLQARIAVLLDRLRLAALVGQLDETQLRAVNASLDGPGTR
ncbi:MAG: TolC family protein [Gammaproteobacteria bacterium]|nr:TolC family protein [Gammaproteobacteria bacterium]